MTSELTPDPGATPADLSRRGVFRGVAVAGVAAPLLAACGADEPSDGAAGTAEPTQGGGGSDGGSRDALTTTADVPAGGGTVFADQQVVVTQPADGEFKAFTAVCTHQGCIVADVSDGSINCNCHGSRFSIEDGSVENGPATQPLAEVPISVEGDRITLS